MGKKIKKITYRHKIGKGGSVSAEAGAMKKNEPETPAAGKKNLPVADQKEEA